MRPGEDRHGIESRRRAVRRAEACGPCGAAGSEEASRFNTASLAVTAVHARRGYELSPRHRGTGHRRRSTPRRRARQRRIAAGTIAGPEVEAPGGKRCATGDRIVTLAPSGDGRYVTSERGTVPGLAADTITVRFDDGHIDALAGDELAADRLDHAYAVTVHRTQGATVNRAHPFADGGGRELAYVAMSRARDTAHV